MKYLHSDVSLPNTAPTDTKITTGPISTQSSIKFFGPRLYRRLVLSNGSSPYSRNGIMNEGQVLGGHSGQSKDSFGGGSCPGNEFHNRGRFRRKRSFLATC